MMALVFVDVFGRYFFNAPIRGIYEILQCLMALVVFTGLPLVTESREHITVGLFADVGGRRVAAIRGLLIELVSASVVAFMALRLWDQGVSMAKSGTVIGLIAIPVAPIAYFMSAMTMLTAMVLCVQAAYRVRGWFGTR